MGKRSTKKVLEECGMKMKSAKSRLRSANGIEIGPDYWRSAEKEVRSAESY